MWGAHFVEGQTAFFWFGTPGNNTLYGVTAEGEASQGSPYVSGFTRKTPLKKKETRTETKIKDQPTKESKTKEVLKKERVITKEEIVAKKKTSTTPAKEEMIAKKKAATTPVGKGPTASTSRSPKLKGKEYLAKMKAKVKELERLERELEEAAAAKRRAKKAAEEIRAHMYSSSSGEETEEEEAGPTPLEILEVEDSGWPSEEEMEECQDEGKGGEEPPTDKQGKKENKEGTTPEKIRATGQGEKRKRESDEEQEPEEKKKHYVIPKRTMETRERGGSRESSTERGRKRDDNARASVPHRDARRDRRESRDGKPPSTEQEGSEERERQRVHLRASLLCPSKRPGVP